METFLSHTHGFDLEGGFFFITEVHPSSFDNRQEHAPSPGGEEKRGLATWASGERSARAVKTEAGPLPSVSVPSARVGLTSRAFEVGGDTVLWGGGSPCRPQHLDHQFTDPSLAPMSCLLTSGQVQTQTQSLWNHLF